MDTLYVRHIEELKQVILNNYVPKLMELMTYFHIPQISISYRPIHNVLIYKDTGAFIQVATRESYMIGTSTHFRDNRVEHSLYEWIGFNNSDDYIQFAGTIRVKITEHELKRMQLTDLIDAGKKLKVIVKRELLIERIIKPNVFKSKSIYNKPNAIISPAQEQQFDANGNRIVFRTGGSEHVGYEIISGSTRSNLSAITHMVEQQHRAANRMRMVMGIDPYNMNLEGYQIE